jgi:hypothetical protein
MEKKRLVGVTVVGWAEIIIGLLGTIVFAMCLFSLFWIAIKATHEGEETMGLLGVIPGLFFTAISPLFLFGGGGIGIIKLKSWGRKINLIVIPIFTLLLAESVHIGRVLEAKHYIKNNPAISLFVSLGSWSLGIIIPVIFFLILPIFLYLTLPKVKEQFK